MNQILHSFLRVSFSVLLVALLNNYIAAQPNITQPSSADPPDVHICSQGAIVDGNIAFTNITPVADSADVTITLPTGLSYIPGTLTEVSSGGPGATNLEILEISGDSSIVFKIFDTDGEINGFTNITFTYEVVANCEVVPGTVTMDVSVTLGSETGADVLLADALAADPSIISHSAVNTAIGQQEVVDIVINNGGFGSADSLTFYIIGSTSAITDSILINGIQVPVTSMNGDTIFYQLDSTHFETIGNADGRFDNNESVTINRYLTVLDCGAAGGGWVDYYAVNFGCEGMNCIESPAPNAGTFTMSNGIPRISQTIRFWEKKNNYCDTAIIQLTYTNDGTDPENNGAGNAYDLQYTTAMNYYSGASRYLYNNLYMGFASFQLQDSTGAWFDLGFTGGLASTNTTTTNRPSATIFLDTLTMDVDGPGGMDDLDGDGFYDDLAVGESFTIRLKVTRLTQPNCPDVYSRFVRQLFNFNNQCGTPFISEFDGGNMDFYSANSISVSEVAPTDVADMVPFNVEICAGRYTILSNGNGGYECDGDTLKMSITLPPGFSILNSTFMAVGVMSPVAISNVGQDYVLTTQSNSTYAWPYSNYCFNIDMIMDCSIPGAPNGAANFPYEINYKCGQDCGSIERWVCNTFTTQAHCPSPCDTGGLTLLVPAFERLTYGFEDPYSMQLVDVSEIPAGDLQNVLPCDTVKGKFPGIQYTPVSGITLDSSFFELTYNLVGGNIVMSPIGGSVEIFDASNGNTSFTCDISISSITETLTATTHIINYNLIKDLPCTPSGFVFEPGDSVFFNPLFIIEKNAGLPNSLQQIPGMDTRFYSLDPLDRRHTCDSWGGDIRTIDPYTVGYAVIWGTGYGCDDFGYYAEIDFANISGDPFSKEIRPYANIDSVIVILNTKDLFNPNYTPNVLAYGDPNNGYTDYVSSGNGYVRDNIPDPIITDLGGGITKLTFINDGSWPRADVRGIIGHEQRVYFGLEPTCLSETDIVDFYVHYTDYAYAVDPACHEQVLKNVPLQRTVLPPDHSITNLTGPIPATQGVECYNIRVSNTTLDRPSENLWLAFEENNSNQTIVSITDITNSVDLTGSLVAYSNGRWLHLADDLMGGADINIEVCVEYSPCGIDNLPVQFGYNCTSYPGSPTSAVCDALMTDLILIPEEAAVQVDYLNQPPNPVVLCDTLDYSIRLNSSQKSDLFFPEIEFLLPPGLAILLDTISVEYPINSGNLEKMPYSAVPGPPTSISVDLTQHSMIGDSIPGLVSQTDPNGYDRQAMIYLRLVTNCDFMDGSRFFARAYGYNACGSQARGFGQNVRSSRIFADTGPGGYDGLFLIDGNNDTLESCGPDTTLITFAISDTNLDGIGVGVGDNDSMFITLSPEMQYISSFCNPILPTDSCLNEPPTVEINVLGETVIGFQTPPEDSIPDAGVIFYRLGIVVESKLETGCELSANLSALATRQISNVPCMSEPSGFCPGVFNAAIGSGEGEYLLMKTHLRIDTVEVVKCDETTLITGVVYADSLDFPGNDTLTVKVYCADEFGFPTSVLIGEHKISGPIAAGDSVEYSFEILESVCSYEYGAYLTIEEGDNCICSTIGEKVFLPQLAVVEAGDDITICSKDSVDLTNLGSSVIIGNTYYYAQWVTYGDGVFDDGMGEYGVATTYVPGPNDRKKGKVVLALSADNPDDMCPPILDYVVVNIINVDCGEFPKNGN